MLYTALWVVRLCRTAGGNFPPQDHREAVFLSQRPPPRQFQLFLDSLESSTLAVTLRSRRSPFPDLNFQTLARLTDPRQRQQSLSLSPRKLTPLLSDSLDEPPRRFASSHAMAFSRSPRALLLAVLLALAAVTSRAQGDWKAVRAWGGGGRGGGGAGGAWRCARAARSALLPQLLPLAPNQLSMPSPPLPAPPQPSTGATFFGTDAWTIHDGGEPWRAALSSPPHSPSSAQPAGLNLNLTRPCSAAPLAPPPARSVRLRLPVRRPGHRLGRRRAQ